MLASKINACAFRETEILNNVGECSSFILVPIVSVDRQIFTFAQMSQVFRCTLQKSSLHHDPDCAMSLFVLLLTPTHLLSQNCRRAQPAETDFGQTDFGQPYLTDFGQTDAGVSHDNPRAQTRTLKGSGASNTTKIPRKDPLGQFSLSRLDLLTSGIARPVVWCGVV